MALTKKQKLMQRDLIIALAVATALTALFAWGVPESQPLGWLIVWVLLLVGAYAGMVKSRGEMRQAYEDRE